MIAEGGGYFAQREEQRDNGDLTRYMLYAWAMSQQLLYVRSKKVYPLNTVSCTLFGKCEFSELCISGVGVDGVKFRKKERQNPQNPETDKLRLTASRMKCYSTCPRKYQYVFEDGIEALGENGEAVYVGSLFHRAAAIWLSQFLMQKTFDFPDAPDNILIAQSAVSNPNS